MEDLTGKYQLPDGRAVMVRGDWATGGFYLTVQGDERDARPRPLGYRSRGWLERAIAAGRLARAS